KKFSDALAGVDPNNIANRLLETLHAIPKEALGEKSIFQISMNRTASAAIVRSVVAVKGDAARKLFSVKCEDIAWAVIDSGIDRTHPAFSDAEGKCRIVESYDFTQFRRIVALGNERDAIRKLTLDALNSARKEPLPNRADDILSGLASDAKAG